MALTKKLYILLFLDSWSCKDSGN